MACSDHKETMRSDLVQELVVLPWRIRTCSVAPYQDRKLILLSERREVLRSENGVASNPGASNIRTLYGPVPPSSTTLDCTVSGATGPEAHEAMNATAQTKENNLFISLSVIVR